MFGRRWPQAEAKGLSLTVEVAPSVVAMAAKAAALEAALDSMIGST
jgi:hypothetical protein